ncbi:lipoate--protein ligase [Mycoplasma miroungirhinis]|uniref:lipoate--protein ligase n=1 Tax=Mycoplasma miroungirhinis TaxID=754516 RepID=A0A6M4JDD9_9MOLU|nr:lipoate--protein ligase [Mycoplasma miroungirhinis]QJR44268.1 lipoate--protein ligase [Mycoplasma miroungirhinis]
MILVEPIRNGKYIKDGAYWLAIQIWAVNHLKLDDIIVFPNVADPHVQIGYFQNPEVEVNFKYLKEKNIEIVRRNTGGGAIYIDSNSVGVCYLIPYKENESIIGNYAKFYAPTIEFLKELGATNVTQSGKNDLTIDGKKVSGAAMMLINDVIYGGNSLLYNVDYDAMINILNPNRKKIEAKGIKSIRQRVAALSDYFYDEYKNLDIFEFKDLVIKKLFKTDDLSKINRYELTEKDWSEIDQLVQEKYKNWDWTFGLSPRYSYNRDARLSIGTVNFSLEVENGKIDKFKISGDFFTKKDITDLEQSILNTKMKREDLTLAFEKANLQDYFFNELNVKDIVDTILDDSE